MKTPLNRKQLVERSAAVFAQFPTQTSLYATADGNFFIQEDRAKLHANKSNPSMKIFEIDVEEAAEVDPKVKPLNGGGDQGSGGTQGTEDLEPKSEVLQGNSKDAIAAIKKEESTEVLEALKADEAGTKNRSTVIKAIDARYAELVEPAQ